MPQRITVPQQRDTCTVNCTLCPPFVVVSRERLLPSDITARNVRDRQMASASLPDDELGTANMITGVAGDRINKVTVSETSQLSVILSVSASMMLSPEHQYDACYVKSQAKKHKGLSHSTMCVCMCV